MTMRSVHPSLSGTSLPETIAALDSLVEGDRAAESLIAHGRQAIPHLEHFLLECPPRSVSLPRCRAVRALGTLGAYSVLLAYFQRYTRPEDAAVLFAEDAVRSAAARELSRSKSDATFRVLLDATKQRATSGLVQSLAEYRRPGSVPLFFALLEDDLCREDAKAGLKQIPSAAQPYAVLLLRGQAELPIEGPAALRRRRATLQLLGEFGVDARDWLELRTFMQDEDLDCVIAVARIGLVSAPEGERVAIAMALIEASAKMHWAQETECVELLDMCPGVARTAAMEIEANQRNSSRRPNWTSPFWRILYHVLGDELRHQRWL
jgi:hypothetical protein